MKTLHEEAFYESVHQPDEVEHVFSKVKNIIDQLESEARRTLGQ